MAISYVTAPMSAIQWSPIDLTGTFVPGAKLFTRKATNPSEDKPTYFDESGIIEQPNPIIADAKGRFNQPIYWEVGGTEKYFVVLTGPEGDISNPISQITNFPSTGGGASPVTVNQDFTNHIINGQFRYFRDSSITLTDTEQYIADSNITFRKSNTTGTDTIRFIEFALGQTDVPANPKYHLRYASTVAGTGETFKDLLIDHGDVIAFENRQMTFQLESKSPTTSSFELFWIQEFGTGGSTAFPTSIGTVNPSTTWDKYNFTITIPSTAGKTIGDGNRALLAIRFTLDAIATIDITNVATNIGNVAFDYEYFTFLQEGARVKGESLPRVLEPEEVGSLQKLLPGSFMSVDDDLNVVWQRRVGEIFAYSFQTPIPAGQYQCNGDSYFSDIDPDLYAAIGNQYGPGTKGFTTYTTSNVARTVNFTGGSVNDIVDNGTGFTFTKVHDGTDYGFFSAAYNGLQFGSASDYFTVTNKANGAVTTFTQGTTSFNFILIQLGTASLPEITNIGPESGAAMTAGDYFTIDAVGTPYYVWYKIDGSGTDPAVGGRTGILVEILSTDGTDTVARKTSNILKGSEIYDITCNAASTLSSGDYFTIDAVGQPYYVDYVVNGVDADPAPGGKRRLKVEVDSSDTNIQVATKTAAEIAGAQFQVPLYSGAFLRGWDDGAGVDPEAIERRYPLDYGSYTTNDSVGSFQDSQNKAHTHLVGNYAFNGDGTSSQLGVADYPGGTPKITSSEGGLQSRPLNYSILYTIQR